MRVDLNDSLGDLVVSNPGSARVLERFGLDYCCHGERSLQDASELAGVDAADVLAQLGELEEAPASEWAELSPVDLAEHIVATHHRYLREELPMLDALAAKVLSVHGRRHSELSTVRELVGEIGAEIISHLDEEEKSLFAVIGNGADSTVEPVIESLEDEHETVGALLESLRSATSEYQPPADGCASYQSLYQRLEAFESDTYEHIHKENHVLFPAVGQLATSSS